MEEDMAHGVVVHTSLHYRKERLRSYKPGSCYKNKEDVHSPGHALAERLVLKFD